MSASKWKPYPINKPLKLGSVEEIPSNWDLVKIKHVVNNLVSGGTPDSGNDDFWSDDDTGIPWVSISDMSTVDFVDTTVKRITNLGLEAKRLPILRKGTIIYSIYASIGKVSVLDIDATVNQAILGLHGLVETDTDFLVYWLKHLEESISLYSSSNTQLNLNADIVGNLPVLRPPLMEQKVISKFLNKKTLDISNSINYFETQLDLLKEKRSALITQAVTKGINPNVPMKDSGIDWYGEIPKHWNLLKMNYVVNDITDIDHYMPKSIDEGVPYLMTGDLKDRVSEINFQDCKQVSDSDFQNLSKKVRTSKGDVILARYATIGTASYVDIERDFLVSYSCVTVKPNIALVEGLFMYYFFKSDAFKGGAQYYTNTGTQGNVGVGDLKKIKMVLPTLDEQSKIIKYLNLNVSILDKLSDSIKKNIGMLNEYRTSLISSAVTGKIDVREL